MPAPSLDELGAQFTSNPDGTAELKLPTGEIFKGNKDEILAHLVKKDVHLRKDRDEWKHKAEAPPPAPVQQPTPQISDELAQQIQVGNYVGDALAKAWLGPTATNQQLLQILNQQTAAMQQLNKQRAVADFESRCPDFPNTEGASDAILKRIEQDFRIKADSFDDYCMSNPEVATNLMVAAHRASVAEKVYEPLNQEQIRAASDQEALAQQRGQRPAAPPLVRTGNPEQQAQQNDPWGMNLNELRNAAIRQQLEGK